jgi:hypothetical protein
LGRMGLAWGWHGAAWPRMGRMGPHGDKPTGHLGATCCVVRVVALRGGVGGGGGGARGEGAARGLALAAAGAM